MLLSRPRRQRFPQPCRVCGQRFTPKRFDALTCTSTCRQRLRRGGDGEYLKALSGEDLEFAQEHHETVRAILPKLKQARANVREERDARREYLEALNCARFLAELEELDDELFEKVIANVRERRAKKAADAK
jgi:hypothetical protein